MKVPRLTREEKEMCEEVQKMMAAYCFSDVPAHEKKAYLDALKNPPKTILGVTPYIPKDSPVKPLNTPESDP